MNSNYLAKFDEINALIGINTSNLNSLLNDAYKTLKTAYIDGWIYAELLLDDKDSVKHRLYNDSTIEDLIFLDIDGEDAFDRLEDAFNTNDTSRIALILSTEYHRLYNAGELGRADFVAGVNKVWTTMEDDRVRENHEWLNEVSIPLDAEFFTPDGDSALYPGGFSSASNNCNCRCWLEFA